MTLICSIRGSSDAASLMLLLTMQPLMLKLLSEPDPLSRMIVFAIQ